MKFSTKKDLLFLILAGFFITNALTAEMIGGKLIKIGPLVFSMGILPWPVVFLATDLINEYFGKEGVKRLTLITAGLISYAFVVLFLGMQVNATDNSPVSDQAFKQVFGQSMWIIAGSIIAFLFSQLMDVVVFWFFRERTGGKMLWLRATGSTMISQLVDSFIVLGIGFLLPGYITLKEYFAIGITNYSGKLIIAILLTPLIYLGHYLIDRYLGESEAEKLIEETAREQKDL